MTWDWSHSPEAYTTLRARLHRMPHSELAVIWGEWKANPDGVFRPNNYGSEAFDERRFTRGREAAMHMSVGDLAERIFELAERHSCCTNGGWEAHICPYGCGPHQIAWSSERKIKIASGSESCAHCGETIGSEEHLDARVEAWMLEDLIEEGVFCSRQHAQDHEHALACEEICG